MDALAKASKTPHLSAGDQLQLIVSRLRAWCSDHPAWSNVRRAVDQLEHSLQTVRVIEGTPHSPERPAERPLVILGQGAYARQIPANSLDVVG